MRGVLVFFLLLLAGCVTVSDGPFRQIDGRLIDYDAVNAFVEGRTTLDEVVARLGEPASRETLADGSLELVYTSTKRRESVEGCFGIVFRRSAQTMEAKVSLLFKSNRLIRKQEGYDVY